jgi:hypothetical protein
MGSRASSLVLQLREWLPRTPWPHRGHCPRPEPGHQRAPQPPPRGLRRGEARECAPCNLRAAGGRRPRARSEQIASPQPDKARPRSPAHALGAEAARPAAPAVPAVQPPALGGVLVGERHAGLLQGEYPVGGRAQADAGRKSGSVHPEASAGHCFGNNSRCCRKSVAGGLYLTQ